MQDRRSRLAAASQALASALVLAATPGCGQVALGVWLATDDGSSGGSSAASTSDPTPGPLPLPDPDPDPPGPGAVGSWSSSIAQLDTARSGHTATVLASGRVLVVGGEGDPDQPLRLHIEALEYDAAADRWEVVSELSSPTAGRLLDPTGTFPTGRVQHSANRLVSGRVLVAGGLGYEALSGGQEVFGGLTTCYLYEPGSRSFQPTDPLPIPRYFHLAERLSDGDVLAVGGLSEFQQLGLDTHLSADRYDAGLEQWAPVGGAAGADVTEGHTWGNLVPFGGRLLAVNGLFADNFAAGGAQPTFLQVFGWPPGVVMPGTTGSLGRFSAAGELYDPTSGLFSSGPAPTRAAFPSGLLLSGAAALSNGDVFFAGGEDLGPGQDTRYVGATPGCELLEVAPGTFTSAPSLAAPRTEPVCVEAGASGDVLIIGGADAAGDASAACELWSLHGNVMFGNTPLATARQDFPAISLGDDEVLVIGGVDTAFNPLASVEVWRR